MNDKGDSARRGMAEGDIKPAQSRLGAGWNCLVPPTEAGGRQRCRLEAGRKQLGNT